jgi:hypothetical protein
MVDWRRWQMVTRAVKSWTTFLPALNDTPPPPHDFHLFGTMNLRGQKFKSNNEQKHSVLSGLHSVESIFYAAGIGNLPGWWKNVLMCRKNALEMSESLEILACVFFL